MIGPMGMLLAGMAIAEVPLKKVFCTPRNYLPVALRLIVVPIIVLLLLRVFHASDWIADGKAILMTVYLSLITPSCATVTSMAQLYNRDAAHSSALLCSEYAAFHHDDASDDWTVRYAGVIYLL